MRFIKDITFMYLEGQGCSGPKRVSSRPHTRFDDGGFTMVVLLVVMAVMAVGMTAMLPTWRQQAIREKEEELIFRGNQYARALVLYSRKNNNLLPPNIDVLYEGKYLRKKWKDPITNADFGLLPAGQPANAGRGTPQGPQGPGAPAGGGRSGAPAPQGARGTGAGGSSAFGGQQVIGSIQGVYSTSTDTSIRVYQNQQRYIDWQFTIQTALPLMGGARGGGAGQPNRQGGPGGVPGRGGPGGAPGVGVPPRGGGPGGGQPVGPRGGGAPPAPPGRGGRGGGR
jgi:type II secretory pathway pseudopilin PulG